MTRQRLRQVRKSAARSASAAKGALLALTLLMVPAIAQDKKPPDGPVGGPNWNTQQQAAAESAVAGITLDARQIDLVKKVNDYFNSIENMRGAFLQTTSDNKRLKGKFFMKKPGRVRFEYAPTRRRSGSCSRRTSTFCAMLASSRCRRPPTSSSWRCRTSRRMRRARSASSWR
jgi:hypothetical protein